MATAAAAAATCGLSLRVTSEPKSSIRGLARPGAGIQMCPVSVTRAANAIVSRNFSGNTLKFTRTSPAARRPARGSLITPRSQADEILRIIPIVCGLVLIGVALGFALLRVEAAIEESEQES